jgi:hypothetical protein
MSDPSRWPGHDESNGNELATLDDEVPREPVLCQLLAVAATQLGSRGLCCGEAWTHELSAISCLHFASISCSSSETRLSHLYVFGGRLTRALS